MAVLGPRFRVRAFSSCGKWGPLFIAVRGPLTIAAPPAVEHRLQTRRLSSCGSRAQLFRGMWDLPRPGLETVSPALAGRLSTTAPPGKPSPLFLKDNFTSYRICGWEFFSFNIWKIVCHLFMASMVSDEKYAVIQLVFSHICNTSFLSDFFQDISFDFRWNYDVSWHRFLCLYPVCGFLSLLDL